MMRAALLSVLAVGVGACSAAPVTYATDADTGSVHAMVVVEERASGGLVETAAFAALLRLPAAEDLAAALASLGREELPVAGRCAGGAAPIDGPQAAFELLAVGEVELEGPDGAVPLVPRAFPTLSNFASGVVYTTLDREVALPAAGTYHLRASGGAQHGGIQLSANAPAPLVGVSVVDAGRTGGELVVTWAAGETADRVVVEVQGVHSTVRCGFEDHGLAVVPREELPAGAARLRVRRVRDVAVAVAGVDGAELRFVRQVEHDLEARR